MEDELLFSFIPPEDVKRSCLIKLKNNLNDKNSPSFSEKSDENYELKELADDIHSLKLFIKSYFENITAGTTKLIAEVEDIRKRQVDLDRRMKKLELFSEMTADELLEYYTEVFNNVQQNPTEIRTTFIEGLGRNNAIVLMKKIEEYLQMNTEKNEKLLERIAFMIDILENDEI